MSRPQTQIKICGIQCPRIASEASMLGANYIGLIFHKQSKRYIDLKRAKQISTAVNEAGAKPVAVFVNQSANEMMSICEHLNINTVQLHGNMARQQLALLPDHIVKIYVLHIGNEGQLLTHIDPSFNQLNPKKDFLLFDGPIGGSGNTINTKHLHKYAGQFDFFIAGGLSETNIASTVSACNPYAVDISSGVEDISGKKDISLIQSFIKRVNGGELIP